MRRTAVLRTRPRSSKRDPGRPTSAAVRSRTGSARLVLAARDARAQLGTRDLAAVVARQLVEVLDAARVFVRREVLARVLLEVGGHRFAGRVPDMERDERERRHESVLVLEPDDA